LLPVARDELLNILGRVSVDALQDIDRIGVGI